MTPWIRVVGLALLALSMASAAAAEPYSVGEVIEGFTLEDQHAENRSVDDSTALILFSRDMDGGDVLKEALAGVEEGFLFGIRAAYVADISGMPALVSRLFAVPSMRKRPYSMMLDREGEVTRRLPDVEGKATVLFLSGLELVRVEHLDTPQQVRALLGISEPGEAEAADG